MSVGVVVNPAAGGGRLSAAWPATRADARSAGSVRSACLKTQHAGDGRDLAVQHVRNGAALVIAAGGDGTANEVVDGLLLAGGGADLGVISVRHRAGFLIRTLGGHADLAAAVEAIGLGADARRIDAGRVTYRADDGTIGVRHFLNVASLVWSGPTVRAVNTSKSRTRRCMVKRRFIIRTVMELS